MIGIAAIGENKALGFKGKIPWHIPADFKWFKSTTMGGVLLMGKLTAASIGKPLPGRETIVLTRAPTKDSEVTHPFCVKTNKEVFLCGGGQIYASYIHLCDKLLITHVKQSPEADVFFPEWEHLFEETKIITETEEFVIKEYSKR